MKFKLLLICFLLLSFGTEAQTWTNGGNGIQYSDASGFRSYRQILTSPQAPYGITDTLSTRADIRKANTFIGINTFNGNTVFGGLINSSSNITSSAQIKGNSIASSGLISILTGTQEKRMDVSTMSTLNSGTLQYANAWPTAAGQFATIPDLTLNLANYQLRSEKGSANGYASLDINGNVPLSQINASLLGAVNYQGTYNATTNTPALATPAAGNKGWYYIVSAPGTQVGLTLSLNDWVISNGVSWGKVDNNNSVTSVAGKVGAVTLVKGDVGLGNVDNTSDLNKPVSTAVTTLLTNYVDRSTEQDIFGLKKFRNLEYNPSGTIPQVRFGTFTDGTTNNGAVILNSIQGDGTTRSMSLRTESLTGVNRSTTFRNLDGTAALTSDFATGQTIGANTTGNSASSTTTAAVSGTVNNVPKFTSATAIGNSQIIDNGTNVGIGTASPISALNVSGNADYTNNGWNDSQVTISGKTNANQRLRLGYSTVDDFGYIQSGLFGNAFKNLNLNPSGGNVGIGTATPNSTLEVAGTIRGVSLSTSPIGSVAGTTIFDQGFNNNLGSAGITQLRFDAPTQTNTQRYINQSGNITLDYKGSATLDFPNVNAGSEQDLNVTVTGAAIGDVVSLGINGGAMPTGISYIGWVSAANTVTVRCYNYKPTGGVDPSSATFKVKVFKD